jgi:hypothetical protein
VCDGVASARSSLCIGGHEGVLSWRICLSKCLGMACVARSLSVIVDVSLPLSMCVRVRVLSSLCVPCCARSSRHVCPPVLCRVSIFISLPLGDTTATYCSVWQVTGTAASAVWLHSHCLGACYKFAAAPPCVLSLPACHAAPAQLITLHAVSVDDCCWGGAAMAPGGMR